MWSQNLGHSSKHPITRSQCKNPKETQQGDLPVLISTRDKTRNSLESFCEYYNEIMWSNTQKLREKNISASGTTLLLFFLWYITPGINLVRKVWGRFWFDFAYWNWTLNSFIWIFSSHKGAFWIKVCRSTDFNELIYHYT